MSDWKKMEDGVLELEINADLSARVGEHPGGDAVLEILMYCRGEASSVEKAKAKVEQHLLELYNALSARYAPRPAAASDVGQARSDVDPAKDSQAPSVSLISPPEEEERMRPLLNLHSLFQTSTVESWLSARGPVRLPDALEKFFSCGKSFPAAESAARVWIMASHLLIVPDAVDLVESSRSVTFAWLGAEETASVEFKPDFIIAKFSRRERPVTTDEERLIFSDQDAALALRAIASFMLGPRKLG